MLSTIRSERHVLLCGTPADASGDGGCRLAVRLLFPHLFFADSDVDAWVQRGAGGGTALEKLEKAKGGKGGKLSSLVDAISVFAQVATAGVIEGGGGALSSSSSPARKRKKKGSGSSGSSEASEGEQGEQGAGEQVLGSVVQHLIVPCPLARRQARVYVAAVRRASRSLSRAGVDVRSSSLRDTTSSATTRTVSVLSTLHAMMRLQGAVNTLGLTGTSACRLVSPLRLPPLSMACAAGHRSPCGTEWWGLATEIGGARRGLGNGGWGRGAGFTMSDLHELNLDIASVEAGEMGAGSSRRSSELCAAYRDMVYPQNAPVAFSVLGRSVTIQEVQSFYEIDSRHPHL